MNHIAPLLCAFLFFATPATRLWSQPLQQEITIPADILEDKVRGGMLGQILGNLNGLPHEFKYIDEPGNVEHYTPSLPNGAVTDDDTDIEWVYLREIARTRNPFLPNDRITALWKRHINRRIFCANLYARGLMDLGLDPPWTGNAALNPWSDFNISGQFICESFGLMAPAMPQTAARIGLHYTHVAIDGEPAQTTQLFTAMIATAFVENNLNKILDAGLAAVDPKSEIARIVTEVRQLHRDNPTDWRATRRAIKDRWQKHGGAMRDRNGYELNTASTVAALLYGQRDFVETLRIAFNFGWDADNNAATAATIIGVTRGRRWMNSQHWNIKNVYRNTTRDEMPMDETLTSLEDQLIQAMRATIGAPTPGEPASAGGSDQTLYTIHTELPTNIEPLSTPTAQRTAAIQHFLGEPPGAHGTSAGGSPLLPALQTPGPPRARAAYLAICLGEAENLKAEHPTEWRAAIADLQNEHAVIRNLFNSQTSAAKSLRTAAQTAGLNPPPQRKPNPAP